MSLTPTSEQEIFFQALKETKESIILEALAGAAKTTSLVMGAQRLPLVPTLSVAFNKRIAIEMAKRMPSHIQCATMNSIGHRVWAEKVGRRLNVEQDKMYGYIKELVDNAVGEDKKALGEAFAGLLRTIRRAKSMGYIPTEFAQLGTSYADLEEVIEAVSDELDVEPDEQFVQLVDRLLARSIADAYNGYIDFDDQIYMSVVFGGKFPQFPIIMVDEAQDLSNLNHEMLARMMGPDSRLIAVGDPNQSIYGFRGANVNSMEVLKQRFKMVPLRLSVSFRCPKAVIRKAQRRVPYMTWPEWAIEGEVSHLTHWSETTVPNGAAIICRSNAPLFDCALRLIRAGRGVKLVGADIGSSLIKLLKKMGEEDNTPQEKVLEAIDAWEKKELEKARESRKGTIIDRANCLRVFADFGSDLKAAIAWAEHLFESTGEIQLMTGHKAKGLEFDIVFHLDPWRIPSKFARNAAEAGDDSKLQQELNIRYVIETRPKEKLFLVHLEDFDK